MRTLIALIAGAIGAPAPAAELGVTFDVRVPDRITVTLEFTGADDGTSRLTLQPEWGGSPVDPGQFRGMRRSDSGAPLASDGPGAWTVEHAPGARVSVAYEIVPAPAHTAPERAGDYRTVLADDFLHAFGEHAIALPDHAGGKGSRECVFRWEGLAERGWEGVCSFGRGAGPFTVDLAPETFRHSVFCAGAIRFLERPAPGGTVGFAFRASPMGIGEDRFADLAARIIGEQREFWRDRSQPWYLVTVNPVPGGDAHQFTLGGTALTNAFAMYIGAGTPIAPGSSLERTVIRVLAHEHTHNWVGGVIRPAGPERLAYWFTEGFTDFYARRTLLRAGIIDRAGYAEILNEALAGAWTNPARLAPAAEIDAKFWTSPDVQRLPYQRGDLVALMLDEEIRRRSDNIRSLDDVVRGLLERARAGAEFSTDDLLAAAEPFVGAEFAGLVRSVVVDGAEPALPDALSDPAATLTSRPMGAQDPGFDVEATRAASAIVGVAEGSSAWEAGLRNGMKLASMSISSAGGGIPVAEVGVIDGDERRVIRYDAVRADYRIPAYRLVE